MPVRIPVIEMIEIGAGGGSIAAVDRLGRLTVGPQSAGSEPGPVAFGRGGTRPTVSDADIVLGYIRPETFAEGQFTIDPEAAAMAMQREVGDTLGLDARAAADGVSRIVDENMASAGRMHAVESGKDLGPRTMIAFGGNGPLHACRVARAAGVSRILIPANPSVGSAVGFLFAPVSFEIVRSRYSMLQTLDFAAVNRLFASMVSEALDVVRQGAAEAGVIVSRTAFMRYHGQGHEIEIALPDRDLEPSDIAPLTQAFETAYARQFSRPVPGMEIEILNWSVRVATKADAIQPVATTPAGRAFAAPATRPVTCDITGARREAAFVMRDALAPGDRLAGPALIAEPQTTTFVGTDFDAEVDASGNLVLTRKGA
jgi:N-methylhydantoinase A